METEMLLPALMGPLIVMLGVYFDPEQYLKRLATGVEIIVPVATLAELEVVVVVVLGGETQVAATVVPP